MTFRSEARRRLLPHAAVIFLLWPAASILFAAVTLKEQQLTSTAPWSLILLGLSASALRMIPEFLFVGVILLLVSTAVFSVAGPGGSGPHGAWGWISLLVEPFVVMVALFCGLTLEYPALLRHPALSVLRTVSALTATIAVFVALGLLLAFLVLRRPGSTLPTFAFVFLLAPVGWALGLGHRSFRPRTAQPGTTVVLGLDSLSQQDEVSLLRAMTRSLSGTWYDKPVPPGLLTNTVWHSLIMHRPVSETGVFLIYQRADWSRSPFQLVRRASEAGCETRSYFSDQFTTYVGSNAGFDRVRSGPKGWLQLGTAELKNGSVFLAAILPVLPSIPGARTPKNQSGTFAFDLRREIEAILTEGSGPCTLVAGHVDYLHQPQYPRYSDLTPSQRSVVRASPVEALQDLSLDWQFPEIAGDELDVYRWKVERLQSLLSEVVRTTGYLEPSRRNRLVLFSDHGNRAGMTGENFGQPQYHRVVFATFGVPPREPTLPISLLDIPELIGYPDPSRPGPAPPVVEYTNGTEREWPLLMGSAQLQPDGEILLDRTLVEAIGKRMQGYAPYALNPEYSRIAVQSPLR